MTALFLLVCTILGIIAVNRYKKNKNVLIFILIALMLLVFLFSFYDEYKLRKANEEARILNSIDMINYILNM